MHEGNERRSARDPEDVARAIRGALPTSRHATMVFDMVRDALGDDAIVETGNEGALRLLFRRDGDGFVFPHPVLRLSTTGRLDTVVPLTWAEGEAEAPTARSGRTPTLRGLGPGELEIHDGPQRFAILYGEDGCPCESSRSAIVASFDSLCDELASGRANPAELLAGWVASRDLSRHGPGRVLYPVPLPSRPDGVWLAGTWTIRDALFDERLPPGARWVVADGYAGTALASGATRDEALGSWRAEVARSQPVRPMPPADPLPDGPEGIRPIDAGPHGFGFEGVIRGRPADIAWPEAAPENTPAVVIPVEATPEDPPPVGSWRRLLGRQGETIPIARREDPGGFTLFGDRLLAVVDLEELDAAIDDVEEPPLASPPPGYERPAYDSRITTWRVVDETTGERVEPHGRESQWSWGIRGRQLDGDRLRWRVVRQRWHGAR